MWRKGKANEPGDMGREEMAAVSNFCGDEGSECEGEEQEIPLGFKRFKLSL